MTKSDDILIFIPHVIQTFSSTLVQENPIRISYRLQLYVSESAVSYLAFQLGVINGFRRTSLPIHQAYDCFDTSFPQISFN